MTGGLCVCLTLLSLLAQVRFRWLKKGVGHAFEKSGQKLCLSNQLDIVITISMECGMGSIRVKML